MIHQNFQSLQFFIFVVNHANFSAADNALKRKGTHTLLRLILQFMAAVHLKRRMAIFLHYIETHYATPLSLEALAKSAHVSKSECLRCFKESLQIAPYQYVMEYRLSKAAELLRSTDMPVGSIAVQVGFQQLSHFGKYFREKTGMSPREYRKAQRFR